MLDKSNNLQTSSAQGLDNLASASPWKERNPGFARFDTYRTHPGTVYATGCKTRRITCFDFVKTKKCAVLFISC
jgi:hypothetical protein